MHEPKRGEGSNEMSDTTTAEKRDRDEEAGLDESIESTSATAPVGTRDANLPEGSVGAEPVTDDMAATGEAVASDEPSGGSLLPDDQNDRFRSSWEEIQASFVDRPQEAVEKADALVADVMQRVTASLTKERERLEGQWAQGDDVSTEDLRVALTRYRTFFDRLLSA